MLKSTLKCRKMREHCRYKSIRHLSEGPKYTICLLQKIENCCVKIKTNNFDITISTFAKSNDNSAISL